MFVNTHTLIAKSIVDNIDEKKYFFISENNFIYGNIKPDLSYKYLFSACDIQSLVGLYVATSLQVIIYRLRNRNI